MVYYILGGILAVLFHCVPHNFVGGVHSVSVLFALLFLFLRCLLAKRQACDFSPEKCMIPTLLKELNILHLLLF